MENWYTLYTKPNAEAQVARTLMARGLTVLLPLLPSRSGERLRPLFPAYLFVRCDLTVIGIENLQWIPGLRRILNFEGRPAVVPDAAIALIERSLAAIEAAGGLPQHAFKPGDVVVIDQGPLAGCAASFRGRSGRPSASVSWCASWARPTAPRCPWRRCATPVKTAWARSGAAAPAGTVGRSDMRTSS